MDVNPIVMEIIKIILIVFLPVWFFFLFHAVQRIRDSAERGFWVFCIICFNIIGIFLYILVKYRYYWRNGERGLVRYTKESMKKYTWKYFFSPPKLREEEKRS